MSDAREGGTEQEGDPASNSEAFRRCLGQYATGVTVITTCLNGRMGGMTSNSFSSLSMDPPLVVWSIRRESRSLDLFRSATHFAVNILAVDQLGLARTFARTGDDKFTGVGWSAGIGDCPILDGVVASLECVKSAEVDGGDHVMLIGRVQRYRIHDRAPLLFAQGRYARVYDVPDGDSGVLQKMKLPTRPASELTTSLMFKAYRSMLRLFEEVRRSEQLSYVEVVFLNMVQTDPGKQIDSLMSQSAFDPVAGRDLASELVSRKLLEMDAQGYYHVTQEGSRRLERIVKRSAEMRREAFRYLPSSDLEAALRVVNEIVARGAQAAD